MNLQDKISIYIGREPNDNEWEAFGDGNTGKVKGFKKWNIPEKPMPTIEDLEALEETTYTKNKKQNRIRAIEVIAELQKLDIPMLRAIEEVIASNDRKKFNEIRAQKQALRSELSGLEPKIKNKTLLDKVKEVLNRRVF